MQHTPVTRNAAMPEQDQPDTAADTTPPLAINDQALWDGVSKLIDQMNEPPAADSPERVLRARARDIARAAVYAVAIKEPGNSGAIIGLLFDLHPGKDPGGAAPLIAADCLAFIAAHYHLPMVTTANPGMTPAMVRSAELLKRLLATYAPVPAEAARHEVMEQLRGDEDLAMSLLLHLVNYTALVIPQMDAELSKIVADASAPEAEVSNAQRLVERLAAFREAAELAYYDWMDGKDTSLSRADV